MVLKTSAATLRTALRDGISELERAQTPSAPLAAELLLMHALGCDRAHLYAHPEQPLDPRQCEQFADLIARRAGGVPTQYLTGHQEFWGLEFEVTPEVLIPRPETEHLIEVALARLRLTEGQPRRLAPWHIADVGTGSGCIAVALASELPNARIVATDISGGAIEVARRNASRHGLAARMEFVRCNLLDAFLHARAGAAELRNFDLIVSNPPYIGRRDAPTLPAEIREHEPHAALFGGDAGPELYAPLIAQASNLLRPGGFLVMELGSGAAELVQQLLSSDSWTDGASIANDLAGLRRVASAQRASA